VYATTKLAQEHLCNAYVREHVGSSCASLRYHNVYGPRMPRDTPYAGVASIFRSAYEAGRAPQVLEDGGQARDFIHVRDIAHCNVLALTNLTPSHGAFNVCTGNPQTVLDMAVALRPPDSPHPAVVGGYRLGDIRHVFASPDRAATDLGFEAKITFEAGMQEFQTAELRKKVAERPERLRLSEN
jgi:dTDP-L-rhamnose 4-epimerase